jgi:NAD(P)-dependent dehydrogenase (short-subunit alcohol dehydrogenase family)
MGFENRKKVCVIDGQGGGIGATIIKKLRERFEERIEVIALGTNAIATAQMLKARANKGASGSNAIVHTVKKADVIIGSIGIIMPQAMMGEVTPLMAEAVCSADAKKILLPLTQENVEIVGVSGLPLPQLVDELLDKHLVFIQ